MNDDLEASIYRNCELAFGMSIAETLQAVLNAQPDLSIAQKEKLLHDLLFAVAAHISGSSHGGEVNGEEVYPVVGYSLGETSDAVFFGNGAAMHEYTLSILETLTSRHSRPENT